MVSLASSWPIERQYNFQQLHFTNKMVSQYKSQDRLESDIKCVQNKDCKSYNHIIYTYSTVHAQ